MKVIETDKAPAPLGPYSQAIVSGGQVYIAMQLPLRAGEEAGANADLSAAAQTTITLENIKAIAEAAGSDIGYIAKITIYALDAAAMPEINEAYTAFFDGHRLPARSVAGVSFIPKGYAVAIDAVAVLPS